MSDYERAEGLAVSPGQGETGAAHAVAQEIGTSLAKARQAQGMSREDIGARLKVTVTKLAAIEAGNLEALPDLTFAKGLMRAYARVLHVDIDGLLSRFHAQAATPVNIGIRPQATLNQSFDDRRRFRTGSSGGRWIWLALVAVVIAVGAVFGLDHIKQWIEAQKEALRPSGAESAAAASTPVVAATSATTPGSEPGTVSAALPPVMAAADASAPSEAVSASASTAPIAPIAPIEKVAASVPVTVPATETKAVTNAVFTAPAAPVAAPVAAAAAGELRLRFAADTWYEIRDRNGKVVLGGTARAGQDVAGGGTPPYKVVIGNVKGVESMTRNGAPVDLQAANHNNVAHITLP